MSGIPRSTRQAGLPALHRELGFGSEQCLRWSVLPACGVTRARLLPCFLATAKSRQAYLMPAAATACATSAWDRDNYLLATG